MTLSSEQIALLRDAAKYVGKQPFPVQTHGGIDTWYWENGKRWEPWKDRGDLYNLMAAGPVYPDWDDNEMLLRVEPDGFGEAWISESFTPNDFTSQAWAVITVCALAQRRKK